MKKAAGGALLLGRYSWSKAQMSCGPVDVGRLSIWMAGVPPLPAPGTARAGEATAAPERPGNNVQGGAGSVELRGKKGGTEKKGEKVSEN